MNVQWYDIKNYLRLRDILFVWVVCTWFPLNFIKNCLKIEAIQGLVITWNLIKSHRERFFFLKCERKHWNFEMQKNDKKKQTMRVRLRAYTNKNWLISVNTCLRNDLLLLSSLLFLISYARTWIWQKLHQ